MPKQEVILIVCSVLGTAIAFSLPLLSLLWRSFSVIAEIRLQIAEVRHDQEKLAGEIEVLDERFTSVNLQTIQRFDHFSNRFRGEVSQLNTQVRDLQNFLAKTTSFEVRGNG